MLRYGIVLQSRVLNNIYAGTSWTAVCFERVSDEFPKVAASSIYTGMPLNLQIGAIFLLLCFKKHLKAPKHFILISTY